eukprot:TRINITY_DN308_c0_g2_i1.p1 TRINITY_DN308_c0_g2~~TRINITY_DN308_c0_g2_i1.p1  ORF type:complete len:414 (-),score=58.26 TRINITY_DN308_c0_g2_i1:440-1681(-)
MAFTLSKDRELVKDHMVKFLQQQGSVTKTLFGIELGTVCKTPTRGRTKILMDLYPDVFAANGDIIGLKYPPQTHSLGVRSENVSVDLQTANNSGSAPPFPFYIAEHPPPFIDSSGSLSPERMAHSENYSSQWYPMVTNFNSQPSFPASGSQENVGYGYPMWDPNMMFQHHSPMGFVGGYDNQYSQYSDPGYVDNMHVQQARMGSVQAGEMCNQAGEMCNQLPSEQEVLEILKMNSGAMEVEQLIQTVKTGNGTGYSEVFKFLNKCPAVIIRDGFVYANEESPDETNPVVGESLMFAGDIPSLEYNGNEEIHPEQHQSSDNRSVPEREGNAEQGDREEEQQQGKREQKEDRDDEVPKVGAKTVRIGSIHVDNINIQVVNLHLHVDDTKKNQVSELVQLQQQIQQLLGGLSGKRL